MRESHRQGALRHYALCPMTEETKAKISQSNTGKVRSPVWSNHISEAKRGKPSSMKGKPQPSSSYKRSEETKRRMSESRKRMLAEHPEIMASVSSKMADRVVGQETRARQSESKTNYINSHPEFIERLSDSRRGKPNKVFSEIVKRLWRENYYAPILVEALNLKPNKQEIALGEIIEKVCPSRFKYNGDYRLGVALNRRIPDFVNVNGKKQVIEFFGSYWHQSEARGEVETIKCYKEVGWDCLVIWDKELRTDVHAVEGKLRAFVGRCDE